MMHSFDPDVASKVGINAAVVFQNLVYWCDKNAANGRHIHEGKAWTYNSAKAFEALFPYLSAKQIRTALEKLEAEGFIASGNFNQIGYDRTKWYTLGREGTRFSQFSAICPNGKMDLPKKANGFALEGEPIPDSKPDIKPDDDMASGDAAFTVKDFVESWNEVASECGLPVLRKLTPSRRRAFAVRQREYPEIEDWQSAFRCLRSSKWMHGDNDKGWRADPDFFLQAKSFTKLVEGSYGKAD